MTFAPSARCRGPRPWCVSQSLNAPYEIGDSNRRLRRRDALPRRRFLGEPGHSGQPFDRGTERGRNTPTPGRGSPLPGPGPHPPEAEFESASRPCEPVKTQNTASAKYPSAIACFCAVPIGSPSSRLRPLCVADHRQSAPEAEFRSSRLPRRGGGGVHSPNGGRSRRDKVARTRPGRHDSVCSNPTCHGSLGSRGPRPLAAGDTSMRNRGTQRTSVLWYQR